MTGLEWFGQRPGGLPRYLMDFSRAWLERGHRGRVLVRVPPTSGRSALPTYVRGVEVAGGPWAVRRAWADVYREELARRSFDVFNPHFAYYAWAWDRGAVDIPVVTHFHGPWAYEARAERQGRAPWVTDLIFRAQRSIEQRVYRTSDQFIVLSEAFAHQLRDLYGVPEDRIHVIPGAVDTERFTPAQDKVAVRRQLGLPQDRLVLLTVRRLARRMGIENLLEAVADLHREFPEVYLVIVGGGSLRLELERRVAALGLTDKVHFAGRIADEWLPKYYQAADLMVVPSLSWEGFGLVTVEAMACGTPVAGTPVGGTKEILTGFSPHLLFPGATATDICNGLRHILAAPQRLPRAAQTRQYVLAHYTWDAVVTQVERVFQLAGGRG